MAKKFSIKGLFFEQGDGADQQQTAPAAQPAAAPAPGPVRRGSPATDQPSAVTEPVAPPEAVGEDAQIRESLEKAIELANQDGYDYFEFAKAVEQQKNFVESEKIRFQTTHAAASVMGVTPQKLVESANAYLDVLRRKEQEFCQAMDHNRKTQVDGRQQEIQTVEKKIAAHAEQIAELTRQSADLQAKRVDLEAAMQSNLQNIESVKSRFYATYKVVADRIGADIEKIRLYLMN